MEVADVDLDRRRLSIVRASSEVAEHLRIGPTKNHQSRSVPLPRFVIDELRPLLVDRDPEELLFTAPRGGPLRNLNFRRAVWDAAATRAGLHGVTPHELRHTAVSLAVSAGANVKAVQRMPGHASAAMTLDVYAGLFEDDLDLVAEKLNDYAVVPDLYRSEDLAEGDQGPSL